jgi:hypothetical protein
VGEVARLAGDHRWERAQPAWLLERLVEGQARLAAERAAAGDAVSARAPAIGRRHADEAATDRARAVALAEALQKLGRPDYARALPVAQPERVALLPTGDAPPAVLEARHEPYARFARRVLAAVSLDELARRPAPILYLSRAAFVADLRRLGPAEREREFRRRVTEGATPAAYAAHLASLDLDQAVLASALLDRVPADAAERAAIAAFADEQLERVRAALAPAIKPADAASRLEQCRRALAAPPP